MKNFGVGLHPKDITNLVTFEFWKDYITLFKSSVPFIETFFKALHDLKTQGKLHDHFYLNYEVENIDFESILISSFINHSLGNFGSADVNKMGVTISELRRFLTQYFVKNNEEYVLLPMDNPAMLNEINKFINQFGFQEIEGFEKYLYGVLSEHLSGYEFDTLGDEDFQHIGGPILLNSLTAN